MPAPPCAPRLLPIFLAITDHWVHSCRPLTAPSQPPHSPLTAPSPVAALPRPHAQLLGRRQGCEGRQPPQRVGRYGLGKRWQ